MNPQILLINPNTSAATCSMMERLARPMLPAHLGLYSQRAEAGVAMIVNEADLAVAAEQVVLVGKREAQRASAIIIAAFGDPGLAALHAQLAIPVVGIGEAAMREAARGGRRFGVATTTPDLVASIARSARALGLGHLFTGTRTPVIDPLELAARPDLQEAMLAQSVQASVEEDGAEAVIIGGGPLSEAAVALGQRLAIPVISPLGAAIRKLLVLLQDEEAHAAVPRRE